MVSIDQALTPELLRTLLRYDPETGKLYWKPRPREMFDSDRIWRGWNTRLAGKEALTADNGKGYKFGVILYHRVYAHRAAWAIHHGVWPHNEIDHDDRSRAGNRIKNLQDKTHAQNCANQGLRSNNTSGHKNIRWDGARQKWAVSLRVAGRKTNVGRFDDIQAAIAARDGFQHSTVGG